MVRFSVGESRVVFIQSVQNSSGAHPNGIGGRDVKLTSDLSPNLRMTGAMSS